MKNYKMNFMELQVTTSLCLVFLLRMLGVFSVLPILSKYALLLNDSNKSLVGISIGIYGFSQVIFQIPFGFLSDKFSKKKIIILGLLMFFIGSIISAVTDSIWGLIIGRAIQGSAAISGISMALLSDLIRKKNHVKAISAIGVSFAISFLISIVCGPLVVQVFNFSSIFWFSSIFCIFCIFIIFKMIPNYSKKISTNNLSFFCKKRIKYILSAKFLKFYLNIFFLHFILTMNFLFIPRCFELFGLTFDYHWIVYLINILISFFVLFLMFFCVRNQFFLKYVVEISIFFIFFSSITFLLSIFFKNHLFFLILALQIFFISFNFLEIILPAKLSQKACLDYKGSIMSIYSTSQFLGIFWGGVLNGFLSNFLNIFGIFIFQIFFVFSWLIFNLFYRK